MKLIALALLLSTAAEALPLAYPRGCRDRSCVRGRVVQATSASYSDGGVPILNGWQIGHAFQCDAGTTVFTQAPVQSLGVTRGSSAYCSKQDGTIVLMPNNSARLERMGLLSEPASTNDVTAPRDCTDSSWTKSNTTCARTTGADGVANAGSLVTATSNNGTALTTVTKSAATRSTSMYLKRITGTGAVSVTRNNGSTYTDVGPSLSLTTWLRVRHGCGGYGAGGNGTDPVWSTIDNCIDVSAMTASVLNPTIGLKLGTSGDAVAIDFIQDEAHEWATSPMSGFSRAADQFPIALDGGLPVSQGELSVDWTPAYAVGEPASGNSTLVDTGLTVTRDGVTLIMDQNTGSSSAWIWSAGSLVGSASSASGYPVLPGNAKNFRMTWGGSNLTLWSNGTPTATSGASTAPSLHRSYTVAEDLAVNQVAGWVSRVRWTTGAFASFLGSRTRATTFGDSIVFGSYTSEGCHPPQLLARKMGGIETDAYVANTAVAGYTIDQCRTAWDANVSSLKNTPQTAVTTLVMQCGINSLADGVASLTGKIVAAQNIAVDAGVHTVMATITPMQSNAVITGVNNNMRNIWPDAGWPFADTERALEYPPDSGILNPAYDTGDHEHGNDAGAEVEVQVWFNAGRDAGYW